MLSRVVHNHDLTWSVLLDGVEVGVFPTWADASAHALELDREATAKGAEPGPPGKPESGS